MGVAQRERIVEAPLVGDQHRHAHLRGHLDAREHLGGVRELRDHVCAHEARHLQPLEAGARERVDQLDLALGGDHLGLVLEAVARAHLPDSHRAGQRAHFLRLTGGAYTRPPWPRRPPNLSRSSAPQARWASAWPCGWRAPACRSRSARATPSAPRRPLERARAAVPGGVFSAHENEPACGAGTDGDPERALSQPVRDARQPQGRRSRAGQLLIDATVPLAAAVGGKATRMLGVWQGSAAQQAAEMAPEGVRVVSALHTVSAASLADLDHALEQDVLLCGDSRADKGEAARLIERIDGLRCVDCGRPRDGAHDRVADRAADLREHPLQGPRGHPPHGPCRTRSGRSPDGRRCRRARRGHRRREARPRASPTWSAPSTSQRSSTRAMTSRSTARTSRRTPTSSPSGSPA